MPEYVSHVWEWFETLNATRQNGFAMNPISQTDTLSFFILHGIDPQPWELEFLRMFDSVAMSTFAESQRQK